MVQVASLRIQIEAQQARQAAQEVRRELDQVVVSSEKATVSTDKLERQMAELIRINTLTARSVNATALGVQRLAEGQRAAAVVIDKTTTQMDRQERSGSKLVKIFGGLAAKTAATGGAFLAVDFLARVAGANSLMDGMNKILDAAAGKFRDLIVGTDTFTDKLNRGLRESVVSLDEFKQKLADLEVASRGKSELLVGVGGGPFGIGQKALDFGGLDLTNDAQRSKVADIVKKMEDALAQRERTLKFSRGTANVRSEQSIYSAAQGEINKLAESYKYLAAVTKLWADEDAKAAKSAAETAKLYGSSLGARMAGIGIYSPPPGFSSAGVGPFGGTPASTAAGQFNGGALQGLSLYNPPPQGAGSPFTPFPGSGAYTGTPGSAGGNVWIQSIAGASAYAVQLARVDAAQQKAAENARQLGEAAAGAFEDAVFNARSFEEGLEGVLRAITRVIFNQLVTQQLASGIASLFPSAKGNVFSGGNVVPFAKGGVLAGPTVFPMNGGRTGIMGEAGPEAVMPLGRNSRGELGVKGGGTTVNFYISTPDAGSFQRSRKQIQSDMRRALGSS